MQDHHGVKVNPGLRSFAIVDVHGYYIEHDNNIDVKDGDWSADYTEHTKARADWSDDCFCIYSVYIL